MARFESEVWRSIGRLTPTEKRIKEAFPRGAEVDLRSGNPAQDDPANAAAWPAERTVRAEVLAALLLGGVRAEPGRIAALRVRGARVVGPLVLAHGTVHCAWTLEDCRFDDRIDLEGAVSGPIILRHSNLLAVQANYARVRGLLTFTEAVIRGDGRDGIYAPGLVVEGNLRCRGIKVAGPVDLKSAVIGGLVSFADADLRNPGGASIRANGIQLRRGMLCSRVTAVGEWRMQGADIGGDLEFRDAVLDGRDGTALRIMGSRIAQDVFLSGAVLRSTTTTTMSAQRIKVGGSFRMDAGFATAGQVRMTGAVIDNYLDIDGIDCPDALLWLRGARIAGGIRDAASNWPGRVNLDGLTYGHFASYEPADRRLSIIRRQVGEDPTRTGAYLAQPYEQLAAYYRDLGHDTQARTVLLAKARAARKHVPWFWRIGSYTLDVLVGYGYRPSRAIGWALGLLAAGSVYFAHVTPQRVSSEDTSVYNPVIYTADRLLPLIHVGQADVWQFHGVAAVVGSVLTLLGWTLGIAIAAGATRTLSRN